MMNRQFTPKILLPESTQTKETSEPRLGTMIEASDVSPLSREFEKCLRDRSKTDLKDSAV